MSEREARNKIYQEIGELTVKKDDLIAKLDETQKQYIEAIQKLKELESKK